jgi:rhodanese-related sulfurtransferase
MRKLRSAIVLLLVSIVGTGAFAQSQKRELLPFEAFEAKLNAAGKNAQILDARLPEEYVQNHLEGAVSFSIANKDDFEKQSAKLSKDKPTFIYSIGNGRSGVLAEDLRKAGFKDVTEIPGGLSKWIGLGRPVISTTGKGFRSANTPLPSKVTSLCWSILAHAIARAARNWNQPLIRSKRSRRRM